MSRISEKGKKSDKGCKGQTKGQWAKNVKILEFFVVLGLFGVNNALILLSLGFKSMKAKMATIVPGKAKLQTGKFVGPKILPQHPEELFQLPLTQNRAVVWKFGLLKAKMYPEGHKIEAYQKIF